LLQPVLGLAALALTACGESRQPPQPCRPAPAAGATSEIDRITDDALRNAMAGKPVMAAADRTAARRRVVVACLHRSAYQAAEEESQGNATDAALAACAPVIDRFVKVEALEGALGGEAIPDPAAMSELRASFRPDAAGLVREAKAGRCWRGLS